MAYDFVFTLDEEHLFEQHCSVQLSSTIMPLGQAMFQNFSNYVP